MKTGEVDLTNPWQRVCNQLGLTREQLGLALEVTQQAISLYCGGRRTPQPKVAMRLVAYCRKRRVRMTLTEIYEWKLK